MILLDKRSISPITLNTKSILLKVDIFKSKLLTADPKEHIRRAKILLSTNNNALLLYAALELRLAIERIIHNQYTLSTDQTKGAKSKNDPKRKKLIMNKIDPESDHDYKIYFIDPENGSKIFWGIYKNIPESKVKSIEGKLGNLLHMHTGLKLGVVDDPWYSETRTFLINTSDYFFERITDSQYYFSFKDIDNYILEKI